MRDEAIRELIRHYREQGAPQDQQMLIALLRDLQQEAGGALPKGLIDAAAQAYGVKSSLLTALIRRVPGLCCEDVPHRLEVCGTCRQGAALRADIERTYGVKSGGSSREYGFAYRVTPCMKNCKHGPSIRWDGTLHSGADMALIRRLTGGQ